MNAAVLTRGSKETSMSLMDKMKEQAAQALTKAQHGVSQGRAKIEEAQAKHHWDGLLRNLGAAVYAEQREGGSSDAVTAAMAALDAQAERMQAEAAGGTPADFGDEGPATSTGQGTEPDAAATEAGAHDTSTGTTDTATGTESTGNTEGDITPEA
jgi:hypothetical protein